MTANHTPGPWVKDYGCTKGHIKAILNDIGKTTPTVARYDIGVVENYPLFDEETMEANGRLIAAAPDLLKALESILENYKYNNNKGLGIGPIIQAEAAIKKARGARMNLSVNGKRIKAIYFSEISVLTNENAELLMEIHGPETWVVQIENGIEVARHNARFIETITWEVET